MDAQNHRFYDDEAYLGSFLDQIWVACPSCAKSGQVLATIPHWKSQPQFTCASCALQLTGLRSRWFGPAKGIAKRPCGGCGRSLAKEINSVGPEFSEEHQLSCPGCAWIGNAPIHWSYCVSGLAHEPAFGLSLILQTECKGNVLWAYNQRHLEFLENYVDAQHRERKPNSNGSLASRLPTWLKSAKNRDAVLKAIGKLKMMHEQLYKGLG